MPPAAKANHIPPVVISVAKISLHLFQRARCTRCDPLLGYRSFFPMSGLPFIMSASSFSNHYLCTPSEGRLPLGMRLISAPREPFIN
eukprot:1601506-Pleurochrysis_carterae.AAC.1